MGVLTDIKVRVASEISGFRSGMSTVKADLAEGSAQAQGFGAKMRVAFAEAGTAAQENGEKVAGFAEKLGLMELAAPLAGFAIAGFALESVKHTEEAGQAAYDMSEKFGLLPTQASAWVAAGEAVGVSGETVSKGFQLAAKNMEMMHLQFEQTGKVTSVQAQAFKDLGVPLVDSGGKFRDLNSIMLDVSDKFKTMPEGPEKAGIAMQLFGRSGAEMIPVLNEGKDGLTGLMEAGKKSGAVMSNEQVEAAHKAFLAHKQFDQAIAGVSNGIGNALMPALATSFNFITNSVVPAISKASAFVQKFHEYLIPVAAFVGVLLLPALVAWTVATWAQVVALTAQAIAMLAAYWPLLLIAAIIAIVIVAVMLLVKHWDVIKAKTLEVWGAIKAFISTVLADIGNGFKAFGTLISDIVILALALILRVFGTNIDAVKAKLEGAWSAITSTATGAWNGLSGAASAIWSAISGAISGPVSAVGDWLRGFWSGIVRDVTGAWDGLSGAAERAFGRVRDAIVNALAGVHLPLPHFSLTGGFDPAKWAAGQDLPGLSVNWYAKGGVFNGPSVIGVGERGAEAVIPLSSLPSMIGDSPQLKAIHDMLAKGAHASPVNVNVYGSVMTERDLIRSIREGIRRTDREQR